ncbi:phosphatase PAP2 family protein [Streptomyces luteocolor]|uniref:phosphatase PAP2 family protein n=1 Tax=Streptomyces luteocolor TaxID=285500 RepID=UPI0008535FE1|nr:phosphatase PAP2 family protein [Streptomyces luteocolor]MCF3125371.1 phosphatase PAP2 family protein [Streptomyces arenae]
MAGLDESGSNPDVGLLYDINGLTKDTPSWFDSAMTFVGEYGLLLALVLLVVWCWWGQRRRGTLDDAASSVAAVVWAPLAAGIAVLVNIPIRGFVERPRPFLDHEGIDPLIDGKTDYSFVSDHATLAMAIGAGLFVANRKFGLVGLGLAALEGFCRVFMGVHYPTDVVGGFALGTAVALLLSPLAMALLTPLTKAIGRTRSLGRLVWDRKVGPVAAPLSETTPSPAAAADPDERDLAA